MNAPIPISKRCPVCGKIMLREDYKSMAWFERTVTCGHVCGQSLRNGAKWPALLAYQVKDGHEMTLEEIAQVAGITCERVRQIEASALRKLARRAAVLRLREELRS